MTLFPAIAGRLIGARPGPEYRQIELYSKHRTLAVAAPEQVSPALAPLVAVCNAFAALDAVLARDATEAVTSWQRYLALPRNSRLDKVVAELYRVLRVARILSLHSLGHVEVEEGLVRLNGAVDRVALSLEITFPGLALLEQATACYLSSLDGPYPEPYVGELLLAHYVDLIAEIKRFADQDRILYQFRQAVPFNRHFRFDCDNAKWHVEDGVLELEIGARHRDAARYPIDFFLPLGDGLHIVPVEALKDGRLPRAELAQWRARLPDGFTLPAPFRRRFARQEMVIGQPMT